MICWDEDLTTSWNSALNRHRLVLILFALKRLQVSSLRSLSAQKAAFSNTLSSVGDLQQRLEKRKRSVGESVENCKTFLGIWRIGKKTPKFTGKLRKIHAVYQEIANSVENIALLIRREIVTRVYRIVNFVLSQSSCFVWFKVWPAGAVRYFSFSCCLKKKIRN